MILENTGRFILLIALQVFVFNNIHLSGMLNPLIYVMIILSLPIEISVWATLLIGFFTGLTIDLFTHTPGMHTMATVFMAYLRPYVLKLIAPREGFEFGTRANIIDFQFNQYLSYASILIFAHHLLLFSIENYSSGHFLFTFQKVIYSTIFTLLLVLLFQYLNPKKQRAGGQV